MIVKSATFIVSNDDYQKCPPPTKPEFAFIGRSNVGKSSLINMLTNNNKLAKVSGQPGKTQLINHFLINDSWYLVDLPGYGYAKTSAERRKRWVKFIQDYILYRENLYNLFVLVDSRLEPQKIDVDFMEWLGEEGIPFSIVFTKVDKQSKVRTDSSVSRYKKELLKTWEELPPVFITSAVEIKGRDELLKYISSVIEN